MVSRAVQLVVVLAAAPAAVAAAAPVAVEVIDADGAAGRMRAPASAPVVLPQRLIAAAREGRLTVMEATGEAAAAGAIPAQFEPDRRGPASGTLWWLLPTGGTRRRRFLLGEAAKRPPAVMNARYGRRHGRVDVSEGTRPVLRYNHAATPVPDKIDPAYARGDYVHPLYGPSGEVVTADYPSDHPHHRAVNWSWATVRRAGQMRDLFAVRGIWSRPVGSPTVSGGPVAAVVRAECRWQWDDKVSVVAERVVIRAFRRAGRGRCVDFEIALTPQVAGLEFCGRLRQGYSGFNLRMAPGTGRQIVLHNDPPGRGLRRGWADYSAVFAGGRARAGVTVLQHRANPLYPGQWRQYPKLNYFQPIYPGGEPIPMPKGRTISLRYRLWVHAGAAGAKELADAWSAYNRLVPARRPEGGRP